MPKNNPMKTYLNFRNNLTMLYKNLPEADLRHVMRVRFWLDYLAATQFLLTGHPRNAWAVYKAREAYRTLKPTYTPLREQNMREATGSPIPELMRHSLLVAFYGVGQAVIARTTGKKDDRKDDDGIEEL